MQWEAKLNQLNKLQKTYQLQYTIIKSLSQAFEQSPQIAKSHVFISLYSNITLQMRELHIYKKLSYLIWQHQDLPIQLRQKCSTLSIISQWIVNFQLKIPDLKSIGNQFTVIKQFMMAHSPSYSDKVILIDQIYQDLKQLFQQKFWLDFNYEQIQNQQQNQNNEATSEDAEQIITLLQFLVEKQIICIPIEQHSQKNKQGYYLEASQFCTQKYYDFVLRCLMYILSLNLKNSLQSSATKLALLFIQSSFSLNNQNLIINLVKKLMTKTKKMVRFALMGQYIEMYQFLEKYELDDILQAIEELVYFRQLIIGQHKFQEKQVMKQSLEYPIQSFSTIYVKAGSRERIFFSNQQDGNQILKLQILLAENADITLRIYHMNRSKQELYYIEQKTSSRKLQIILKYQGLYYLQFDNVYSWIYGKDIKYKLTVYNHLQTINDLPQYQYKQ